MLSVRRVPVTTPPVSIQQRDADKNELISALMRENANLRERLRVHEQHVTPAGVTPLTHDEYLKYYDGIWKQTDHDRHLIAAARMRKPVVEPPPGYALSYRDALNTGQ